MSEQIEDIFKKHSSLFISRQDEMKDFLLRYFEKAFQDQLVEDVQRVDATDRIKTAGFQKEISAWRNTYRNIILSTCVVVKDKQKRYDYKFLFVEERLDEGTIETIENAMDEASKLRRAFKFDDAIAKIDEMIELIRKEQDEVFNKRLLDAKREILAAKAQYERGMAKLTKFEQRYKENQKNNNLEEVVSDCDKIIKIADSIKKGEVKRKYQKILDQTNKEIQGLKDIKRIEKRVNLHRANENYEDALKNCEKILGITKNINKPDLDEKYNQLKSEIEKELVAAREKYESSLNEIKSLEEEIEKNRKNNTLEPISGLCEKIIEIARTIKFNDIVKNYSSILQQTKKEVDVLKEIEKLEEDYKKKMDAGDLEAAIADCQKIVKIAQSIERADIVDKYSKLRDDLKKKISTAKEVFDKIIKQISELEKEYNKNRNENKLEEAAANCERIMQLADSVDETALITKYSKIYDELKKELEKIEAEKQLALKEQGELVEKARKVGDIVQIEENVLPLIEEFAIDDILGNISGDISDSLEEINAILEGHRVEVKKEIVNKAVLKSVSGEVVELDKKINIKEPEGKEATHLQIQSGFDNPFDDVIEEAIITDLIPYNFEITKIEINGKPVEELPDKSMKQEGLEVKWQLKNIQPKEKVEINYDLRRRISRTIIFILEDQLKIIKTHSNITPLELEGFFEAKMPFTNSYDDMLDGVIVEDIIPLYYLHFIKEPTNKLPDEVSKAKQGDLVKWNVGSMDKITLNYHYKLLELYKFEEIKILISRLDKEGLDALFNNDLIQSLDKYKEVVQVLSDFIK